MTEHIYVRNTVQSRPYPARQLDYGLLFPDSMAFALECVTLKETEKEWRNKEMK